MDASRKQLLVKIGAVAAALAVAAAAYYALRPVPAPPAPPEVALTGTDPRVAFAVRDAQDAVRAAPRSGAAWGRLGQVLLANEFYEPAQESLARAEEFDPTNPRWPYLQARMNAATNPLTEAKLRRAIELCGPETVAGPVLHLAEWLLSRGRLDEAEAEFARSLTTAPNNPWGRVGRAKVALARGDAGAAFGALDPPGAPQPGRDTLPRAYYALLAEIEQRRGDPAASAAAMRRWRGLPKDPDPPDQFSAEVVVLTAGLRGELVRAQGLLGEGRVAEAVAQLALLVREYPASEPAWLALGRARLAARDYAGAEEAARGAARVAPDSTPAHALAGQALLLAGRPADAAVAFRRAIECQPGGPTGYLALAEALEKAGDKGGAVAALRDGIRHAPQEPALHAALGERLLRAGRNADALPHLRDAVRLAPDDAKVKSLLNEAGAKQ